MNKKLRLLLLSLLLLLLLLITFITYFHSITKATRSTIESKEFESLIRFLRALDPENVLQLGDGATSQNPCLDKISKGVKFGLKSGLVVEISLEKSNLSGVIDFGPMCELSNIEVLNLAENRIRGNIQLSIAKCKKLVHLNLSNNLLTGKFPVIRPITNIKILDLSNNNFEGSVANSMRARALLSQEESTHQSNDSSKGQNAWMISILIFLGLGLVSFIAYFLGKKLAKLVKKSEISKSLIKKTPTQAKGSEELGINSSNQGESEKSSLFFFDVPKKERFELDDLLEATADLSNFGSLFKVRLKNGELYAVKRLTKLEISSEEFSKIMTKIGSFMHQNILPLVAYCFTHEDDKLLIYKYQNKGSLLSLVEDYIEGKREFKWGLRLSIIRGIARGLSFIYGQEEVIPHGDIKLSNILLDENEEPLIREFGLSKFSDPKGVGLCSTKGYTAPERGLNEKSDVYSFGIVVLELLTGKLVEKTAVDLPRWVNAVIREEWTGEVFDRRLAKSATHLAFPLLNVALKCVSYVPENRPSFREVLERIEEVIRAEDDHDMSTMSSINECHQECCHLHSLIPDTWDTPGSNY